MRSKNLKSKYHRKILLIAVSICAPSFLTAFAVEDTTFSDSDILQLPNQMPNIQNQNTQAQTFSTQQTTITKIDSTSLNEVAPVSKLSIKIDDKSGNPINQQASQTSTTQHVSLQKIEVDSDDKNSFISIKFDKNIPATDLIVEEHGTFIQVKLNQAIVVQSGVFYNGSGPFVTKSAAFQVSPQEIAIRVFVTKDAAKIKEATKAEVLSDRIILTLDHIKIEQLLPIATADITKKIDASTGTVKSDGKKDTSSKSGSFFASYNLKEKLVTMTLFFVVLLFGFLGLYFLKPLLRRKSRNKNLTSSRDAIEIPEMKIASSLSISPKQKLTLVQIGNQQVLIGVTPDSMTFMTVLGQQQKNNFAEQLLEKSVNSQEISLKKSILGTSIQTAPSPLKRAIPSTPQKTTASEELAEPKKQRNYDDISKLIRERLKQVPTI